MGKLIIQCPEISKKKLYSETHLLHWYKNIIFLFETDVKAIDVVFEKDLKPCVLPESFRATHFLKTDTQIKHSIFSYQRIKLLMVPTNHNR